MQRRSIVVAKIAETKKLEQVVQLTRIRADIQHRASLIPADTVNKLLFVFHEMFDSDEHDFLYEIHYRLSYSRHTHLTWQMKLDALLDKFIEVYLDSPKNRDLG